jgi:hypothetical protein
MTTSKLTKYTTAPLFRLYQQITHLNNLFTTQFKNNKHLRENKTFSNEELTNLTEYPLYIKSVQNTLLQMDKHLYNMHFTVNDKTIHINLVLPSDDNDNAFHIFKQIYTLMHILVPFSDEDCSKTLTIYLFMSPSIKLLPNRPAQIIDQHNINTAFTYACKRNNEIHIYRQEEWFKVLIHESFHSFGLDFASIDSGFSDKFCQKIFYIHTDFRLYESYCETWATIINCMFFIHNETPKLTANSFQSSLNECIQKEIEHSLFQCAKLLHYFGMQYTDFYDNSETAIFARRTKYKEDTPVVSYFFFKTMCLYHTSEFISWCIKNNNKFLTFLNHSQDMQSKIRDYAYFIQQQSRSPPFVSAITSQQRAFNKKITNITPNEIERYKNMKMTYHS